MALHTNLRACCPRLCLFVSLATAAMYGQSPASFTGPRAYLGNGAAVADFNGDGILDLATIDIADGAIHFHSGLGNGTFAHDQTLVINTAAYIFRLATADLNGDGRPDLVVGFVNTSGYAFVVGLLGDGAGGFTRAEPAAVPIDYPTLQLADLNGDGHMDIVLSGAGAAFRLLGNGDGTFQPERSAYSLENAGGPLAIADFNGDGNLDLAVPVSGGMFILFGDGPQIFQRQPPSRPRRALARSVPLI